jgi:hypothetical protein
MDTNSVRHYESLIYALREDAIVLNTQYYHEMIKYDDLYKQVSQIKSEIEVIEDKILELKAGKERKIEYLPKCIGCFRIAKYIGAGSGHNRCCFIVDEDDITYYFIFFFSIISHVENNEKVYKYDLNTPLPPNYSNKNRIDVNRMDKHNFEFIGDKVENIDNNPYQVGYINHYYKTLYNFRIEKKL